MNYSHNSSTEIPDFPLSTAHIPIPSPVSTMNTQPPVLRPKRYSNVTIKFTEKELKFRYCMDSNAPPTVLELITNCKQAFGIINSTRILSLKDVRSSTILKTDHELERVLRMTAMLSKDGTGEILLELVFANVTQGYLNLNYESTSKSKIIVDDDILLPDNNQINVTTCDTNIPKPLSPVTNNINIKKNESSLIGRYLPPPRPIRPDVPPRNVFMKFQPLL
ncbi:hypothetical protein C6P40_004570 [Pichia californica]|uniref:Uncharacterized protein n=1 Tax=Pichia californica TaxID=460514 RepID=A0A9P6WFL6_9ASCO|nr:hypothetical protein C6P42_004642 [[Candida] californica]KAG0686295.1 hypothetical protein C6P40_004570 [[Candida] californica]